MKPGRQKATRLLPEPRLSAFSDFAKITAFDEGDKFIPFGMRQSNHVRILADSDLLIGDHDFGALRTKRARGELDGFHLDLLLDGPGREPYGP